MKIFRVEVVGAGFSAEFGGEHKDVGFLCVRVVHASAEAEARKIALEGVRDLSGFKALVAAQPAGARHDLNIDEIIEIEESQLGDTGYAGTGLIFFDERL